MALILFHKLILIRIVMNRVLILFVYLQCVIVKLKMDKDRKKIIDRRAKGRAAALGKDKGKYTEESAAAAVESS